MQTNRKASLFPSANIYADVNPILVTTDFKIALKRLLMGFICEIEKERFWGNIDDLDLLYIHYSKIPPLLKKNILLIYSLFDKFSGKNKDFLLGLHIKEFLDDMPIKNIFGCLSQNGSVFKKKLKNLLIEYFPELYTGSQSDKKRIIKLEEQLEATKQQISILDTTLAVSIKKIQDLNYHIDIANEERKKLLQDLNKEEGDDEKALSLKVGIQELEVSLAHLIAQNQLLQNNLANEKNRRLTLMNVIERNENIIAELMEDCSEGSQSLIFHGSTKSYRGNTYRALMSDPPRLQGRDNEPDDIPLYYLGNTKNRL